MDPPLIIEGSFSTSNPSLAEIWPSNGGNCGHFGSNLINNDGSIEESSVTEQSGSLNERKRRENFSQDESSKVVSTTSCGNHLKCSTGKRMKTSVSGEENDCPQSGGDTGSAKPCEKPVEPLKDYIHVRARRGQATDSHSLAERARREKISERMKVLQDLVPGCNKVIGKAIVLDEIINYIQSLQRQVEFLSMKLEAVNSGIFPSFTGFHSTDVNQFGVPPYHPSGMMFSAQAERKFAAAGGTQSEWLHMQLGGSL